MKSYGRTVLAVMAVLVAATSLARAEMLAMVTYETKAEESIRELRVEKALKVREDGLAIIDVDPESESYGRILAKFPLPEGAAAHHQYYNPDKTKIYVGALLMSVLHVVDITRVPYRIRRIDMPDCNHLDNIIFSEDGKRWWLSCVQSDKILIGDAATDRVVGEIPTPDFGPHGLALNETIDRILVTSMGIPPKFGETITAIEATSGTPLTIHKVSNLPSPSAAGPAMIRFLPRSDPPLAYVTNMFSGADSKGSIWTAIWNPAKGDFEVKEAFNFETTESAIPVALAISAARDRLFVTTANPGHFHVFDIADDPLKPKLLKTLPAAQGAHHIAFSPDERLAFVENGVLNWPGFSDGSITVIDLEKLEVIDSIDTFKDAGYAINHILMLPEWHRAPGE